MQNYSKLGWGIGILSLALLIGGGLGLLLSRSNSTKIDLPPAAPSLAVAAPVTNAAPEIALVPPPQEAMSPADAPEPEATWDSQLSTILVSGDDENTKANQILALMQTAPDEGKTELAQHLVNMVQDDNYAKTAELLTNATTFSGVSTVLMNDLLNRNNELKLPLLLAVARNDEHPLKSDAKDMLELIIQDDKGTNWSDWEGAIDAWLKENQQQ